MHTQVLKSASALGESFGSRHVRELHTLLALQPSAAKVDAHLGKLHELQQLEFHSEQLSYSFRSSLMRDVIYTSMTFESRKALHTAAADLLLQGHGRATHTKHLAAYYHLRQAENEPRVLCLTTDAAQQALLGTNWNDAIDVLELGLDALEEESTRTRTLTLTLALTLTVTLALTLTLTLTLTLAITLTLTLPLTRSTCTPYP